jgi:integrase
MRLSKLMPNFLAWNQAGDRCKKDYVYAVNRLIKDVGDIDVLEAEMKIVGFFESKKHLDPTTYNNYKRRLRVFFEYARRHRHIQYNPIDLIASRRHRAEDGCVQDEHVIKTMPREMVHFILRRIKNNEPMRYYLPIALLAETGARPIEVCRLKKENLNGNCIHFKLTKTGNPRFVYFSEKLSITVKNWSVIQAEPYLIPSESGLMQSSMSLSRVWTRNANGCITPDSGEQPTLYALRHTKATELLREGLPLGMIAKSLGMSIATLNRYLGYMKQHSLETWEQSKHLSYVS